METFSPEFFVALGSIIVLDLALAGDNAVVIAMAANRLQAAARRKAILIGTVGAVVIRLALTCVAVWLLTIPYLQFIGGLILLPIAVHLLAPSDDTADVKAADNLWGAIKTILIADATMSLDNVLSIAGAANGHFGLVVIGLMISIPIVVAGSTLIGKLMDRFPVIMYVGAAIIGWTSGKMMLEDGALGAHILGLTGGFAHALPAVLAVGVCVLGWLLARRAQQRTA